MAKYVGGTPQQFDACFCLFLFSVSDNFFQVSFIFFNCVSFCHQVYIVETVIFDAHFLHEFKACIHFVFSSLNGIIFAIPWELFCSTTKLITTFRTECMPPCHGKFQPVFHFLTIDHLFSIVVAECHWVLTIFTFKFNFFNSGEILFCCHNLN